MTAVEALLTRIIDYAGLFPPASLDMESAVRTYQGALRSDESWMLGNFVLPAKRLAEFARTFNEVCCDEREQPWMLSVVCTEEDVRDDARMIDDFQEGAAFLAAFEAKAIHDTAAWNTLAVLARGPMRYIEFPPELAGEVLPVLVEHGARAKIRTGGVTAPAIPPPETIISFLRTCEEKRVAFKATAGLHRALRGVRRLTYEMGSPEAKMHGFLNVFFAAGLAQNGAVDEALMKALLEENPVAFQFEDGLIAWRDERLTLEQIVHLRSTLAISFGSCSFSEPVDDLKEMGWL